MLSISGMHCATCAQKIEKVLAATKGILSTAVNFSTERAVISYDEHIIEEKKIFKIIEKLSYTAEKTITENEKQIERKKMIRYWLKKLIIIALLTIIILFGPFLLSYLQGFPEILHDTLLFILTTLVLYIGGFLLLRNAFDSFRRLRSSPDLLPGIGITILYIYSFILTLFPNFTPDVSRALLYGALSVITVILVTLKWISLRFEEKINESFENLLNLEPKKARVVRHGTEMEVDIKKVKIGDIVKVKSGEAIPVDGIIIEGNSLINEMIVAGNGNSVEKNRGDEVITATINLKDTLIIKTTQVGENSTLSQIISLLKDRKKYISKKQKASKTMSTVGTILTLIIAGGVSIGWGILGAPVFIIVLTATSILIIANPEAFTKAVQIPMSLGIEKSASRGILFRGGKIIEIAGKLKHIVFDKTGTVTRGIPEITNIITKEAFNEKRFLILVGSLENASTHPFAETIVEYCKLKNITFKKAYNTKHIEGLGLIGTVDGQEIIAGNLKLMGKSNVQMNEELLHKAEILSKNVRTPVFVARNRELIGIVGIADTIKEHAKEAIPRLQKKGYQLALVTGDNQKIAENIANEIRIKNVISDLLQREKIEVIQGFQEKNEVTAFVGDGINDAPVLGQADIGMAIGAGTDISLELSDLTFISDDLRLIDKALSDSLLVLMLSKQNFIIVFLYHIIVFPLAAGIFYPSTNLLLHPVIAPFFMGALLITINLNSLKLKKIL